MSLGNATEFRLQPFPESRGRWGKLVEDFPGATLYHRDSWLTLLATAYRLPLWVATLIERGTVIAASVFSRSPLSRRFVALSFSDACPPLSRDSEAAHRLLSAMVARAPSNVEYEIRGIGGIESWATVDCFVNWQLDLSRPVTQLEKGLAPNFRRNLKRAAQESITVERGSSVELMKRFYAIQLESRRRLGLPPQPRRFFQLAREIFVAGGNLEVWVAQEGGKDKASAVFIRDGEVMHYKWGARTVNDASHANHLLFWSAIQRFASSAKVLDLGRADVRNLGLMRFKRELGGSPTALPSAFYPRAPKQVSAEVLTGARKAISAIWAQLPISVTQVLGGAIYRYLG
jgi:hypothetical protein